MWFAVLLLVLVVLVAYWVFIPWVLELAWNHTAVPLFHAPVATLKESFFVVILLSIVGWLLAPGRRTA